mmetsp:Transcript_41264/g.98995  ORF Transcript_41264/g.98995 Transcript_41264/m.98995 type:complete len:128 (-) Transcript_41264:736-1119(-)
MNQSPRGVVVLFRCVVNLRGLSFALLGLPETDLDALPGRHGLLLHDRLGPGLDERGSTPAESSVELQATVGQTHRAIWQRHFGLATAQLSELLISLRPILHLQTVCETVLDCHWWQTAVLRNQLGTA